MRRLCFVEKFVEIGCGPDRALQTGAGKNKDVVGAALAQRDLRRVTPGREIVDGEFFRIVPAMYRPRIVSF
jgi:hypothetical protein